MRIFARLCGEYADRCLRLADECQTDRARRVFKLLAVDLMLEAERQRAAVREVEVEGRNPRVIAYEQHRPFSALPPESNSLNGATINGHIVAHGKTTIC